ncbi:MAG TPA: conjugative transposon protein TraM [Puia sp.]|jgi:hypothetical protein
MKLAVTKQQRRFLLVLPLIVLPFLGFFFHSLGGGSGADSAKNKPGIGLNTQLPAPTIDPSRAFENKLKAYQQAENDSARRAQYQRQDPYRRDTPPILHSPQSVSKPVTHPADTRSEQLLQQLARLQQSLHQSPPSSRRSPLLPPEPIGNRPDPTPDPQLDRLNTLLDKVIHIQHPTDAQSQPLLPSVPPADKITPADTTANSIFAGIPEDQTLTNGATIAIRITDSIRVNGRTLSPGRLVFGTVTFNNDRLLVHINSLREATNLYTVDWQVYDLDGLPGIHMPALLGRDVTKQSADQGIGSLNILPVDPSLGAQAAGAGVQAAKSFLSHKVRQVRVTVKAGYQLLLRDPHEKMHPAPQPLPPKIPGTLPQPPDWTPGGAIGAKTRNGGVELILRDILIKNSCLWFGLEWLNRSPIVYNPAYTRWYIRSRKVFRQTAIQEQTVQPLTAGSLPVLGMDSLQHTWFGFKPFALPKDKQLQLEVGEKGGFRVLTLIIRSNQLLKAKTDETSKKN